MKRRKRFGNGQNSPQSPAYGALVGWSAESVEAEAIKVRPKRLEGLLATKIELKSIKGH